MIAQLFAQCIAVLILPRLPDVQIISTVQEAPLPYMAICLTKKLWKDTAELLTSDLVRNGKKMRR